MSEKPLFEVPQEEKQPRTIGFEGQLGEEYPLPIGHENQQQMPRIDAELDEFGQRPATEEEQRVYSQFVHRAREFMVNNAPQMIQRMSDPQRPVYQQVGELALDIVENVAGLAQHNGVEIDEDTMLAGGEEVVESLMELGEAAKIFPFKGGDDKYMETMSMALMFGAETKANQMIEQGDPQVKASYEDKLAFQMARESDRGVGLPDEFYQGMKDAKRELSRRPQFGVK